MRRALSIVLLLVCVLLVYLLFWPVAANPVAQAEGPFQVDRMAGFKFFQGCFFKSFRGKVKISQAG